VKIEKGEKKGVYNICFGSYDEKINFEVIPVYDKTNIGQAVEVFEKKFEEYKKLLLAEIEKEKIQRNEKAIAEKKSNEKLMEKYKEEYQEELNYTEKRDSIIAAFKKSEKAQQTVNQAENAIYRTFSIRSFGIYNCDCPRIYPKGATIAASFADQSGKPLSINKITFVELSRKILFPYYSGDFNYFRFDPEASNLLLGITMDGKLAYFTAADFKDVKTSGAYTFKMKIYSKEVKSSADIDDILAMD
jgi:hypothetical protein